MKKNQTEIRDHSNTSTETLSVGDLWVKHGIVDIPIVLPSAIPTKSVIGFHIDLGGLSGDGFIEFHAVDPVTISERRFWSPDEKILFNYRASIKAAKLEEAHFRSTDFVEKVLDRLSYLAGVPAVVVESGPLLNETELLQSLVGERPDFACSFGGIFTFTTAQLANPHAIEVMRPNEAATRALRWYRKAQSFENVEDRFLAYYFSLECIGPDICQSLVKTHVCPKCQEDTGLRKNDNEGIRSLLSRRTNDPKHALRSINTARNKLVHGAETAEVKHLEPLLQRLAADGIALSIGVNPNSITYGESSRPSIITIATAEGRDYDFGIWKCSVAEKLSRIRNNDR